MIAKAIVDCANQFFSYRIKKYKNFKKNRFKPYILSNFLQDYKDWINIMIKLNKKFYLIFVQKYHSEEILEKKDLEEFEGKCKFIYISIDWNKIDVLNVSDYQMKMLKQYDDHTCIALKKFYNAQIISRDKFKNFEPVEGVIRDLDINIYVEFSIC